MKASPTSISLQKRSLSQTRSTQYLSKWEALFMQPLWCLCRVTPHPCRNYTTVCIDGHFLNIWNCSKHIKTKFSRWKAQWESNDLLVPEQECCYSLLFLNVCYYSSPYGSGHACLSSTLKLLSCSKRWFQLMTPSSRTFLYCTIHSASLCSVLTVYHRECSISVN